MRSTFLFRAVSPIAVALMAQPALAQDGVQDGPSGTAGQVSTKDGDPDGAIIVSALRRNEELQRIPMQIDVVSGKALSNAGVTQLVQLQTVVPGISLTQAGPYTQFAIRGVSTVVTTPFQDAAVALNLDDVYLGRQIGTSAIFYDIERVEVLKGPQGTLYGRNATAGAVNVITAQPRFEDSFGLNVEYGSYDQIRADGYANIALNDHSAIRASFQRAKRDGYYEDGYDDEDSIAGRLQFRAELSPAITLSLSGDYAHEQGKGSGVVPYPPPGGDVWAGMSSPEVKQFIIDNLSPPYSLVTPPGRTHLLEFGELGYIDHDAWGVRGKVDWDIGPATLTTIAAYRETKIDDLGYPGGFITAPDYDASQVSFETRLASNPSDSPFQWLVGFYYFRESIKGEQTTVFVNGASTDDIVFGSQLEVDPLTDETFGFFTENTFSVTDRLRVTGGLRYFEETKTNEGSNTSYSPFPPVSGSIDVPGSGKLDYKQVNYRARVEYDVAEDSLLYASVADGFKAGGFYTGAAPSAVNPTPNSYRPATLTAYTVGIRNQFFDHKLTLNIEAFYWDYRDRQFVTFGPVNSGTSLNVSGAITVNVGKSHIQGISLESTFRPTPNTRLSANVEFLDEAINDDFVYAAAVAPGAGCTAAGSGMIDCSGTPITQAPKWSATLGVQQTFDIAGGSAIDLSVQSKIESRSLLGPEELPDQYQKAYTRTDASLTYRPPNDNWEVAVFVRNLEDRVVRTAGLLSPITTASGSPWGSLLAPRTWGVRAGLHF